MQCQTYINQFIPIYITNNAEFGNATLAHIGITRLYCQLIKGDKNKYNSLLNPY